MDNSKTLPVIASVEIPVDQEGRYNLNALHKASGEGPNKAPAQWMRTQQAQEFIKEIIDVQICTSPVSASKGGADQGTFAHELIAVEYAGWINAGFRIKVNQTFIDYRMGRLQPALNHANFSDPIIAALVHGLMEIDTIKQHQANLDRKTEILESRVEHVELQHRNGVPEGHLSRKQAHILYGKGLSEDVFHRAMKAQNVPTKPYIHRGEDGNDVATHAYYERDLPGAVREFLTDAFQATSQMCESPMLNHRRFRFVKVQEAA